MSCGMNADGVACVHYSSHSLCTLLASVGNYEEGGFQIVFVEVVKDAVRVLEGVKDIAVCKLTSADVVRHALVQQIINAYERAEKKKEEQKTGKNYPGNQRKK